jgi:hypothetical protein
MPGLSSTLADTLVAKVLDPPLTRSPAFLLPFSCVVSISSYKERRILSTHATCDISNLPATLATFVANS